MDDHEAEYWARQLRISAVVAAVVTAIGGVRVAMDWPASARWWLVPIAIAVVLQLAALAVPWTRLVRSERRRNQLIWWWIGELLVLMLFGLTDPAGWVLYLPATALLQINAAALWRPRFVLVMGAVTAAGYAGLLAIGHNTDLNIALILLAMMACSAVLTAVGADSRRRLDARRRSAEHRTETILVASADAVLAVGPDELIKYVSPSLTKLLGFSPAHLLGRRIGDVMVGEERAIEALTFLARLINLPNGETERTETRLRTINGDWVFVDVIGTNWIGDPDLQAFVISIRDIGARRELEGRLSRQAYTDSLTGLPNRAYFRRELAQAIDDNRGAPVTVLLLDLDDFKLVNDNLGHSAGDDLLCALAERLRVQVRPGDLLARLGGDEFAVLVRDLDPADAAALAERLLGTAHEPIRLGSRDVTCSMSLGIATTGDCDTADSEACAEQILGNADLAMYAAKKNGRNAYALFDPTMTLSVLEEAQLRADIERALEHGEFAVLYQPVVDMQTQRMTAVEALVRWEHPTDGLLGPYHFIAAAEANGLIVPLGRWVLRQACAQLAAWRAETPRAAGLKMNVNLSARQFQYAGLVDDVAAALADTGLDAASLTLEITESMLMADIDTAKDTLHALRGLGVRLAIDDFGTGYSSLSYLKQLPVDVIKIDKTFVDEVHIDEDDVALVDAVAGLGQALKMQTVAEGIETDEQWATLRRLGIDHGQGYLFGRPVAPGLIADQLHISSEIIA